MQWILPAVLVAPLIASASIALGSMNGRTAGRVGIIAMTAAVVGALVATIDVARSGALEFSLVGDLVLTANRSGVVLLILVAAVSVVVQSFARRALDQDPSASRFFALSNLLSATTMAVAIVGNASLLLGAWVITGITLAAMVGHHRNWVPAREASKRTQRAFLIGDLPLALATILTLATVGDIRLDQVDVAAIAAESINLGVGSVSLLTLLALSLVIAGVSRSALIPFHRWLPATLAAPTPVSAMLHAGVVNGAGVLLIRFAPVYAASTLAMAITFVLGLATAVWATGVMLVRSDVKGSLVYSTAGQMGFMTLQLAVGAFAAALFHIVGHAMYKAALFLGAGGSITAAAQHRHLPHRPAHLSVPARLGLAAATPALAMGLAFAVINTHLTAASTILVVLFGWISAATALNGWLSAPPWNGSKSTAVGAAVSVAAVFGYVGGLTLFETFVVDTLPYDVPAAVGPVWLALSLAAVALATLVLRFSNAPIVQEQRQKIYVGLLGAGYQTSSAAQPPAQQVRRRTTQPNLHIASVTKG